MNHPGSAPDEWNEPKPLTEEEAERLQQDSDRLAARIQARLEREGPEADYEQILEEELERRRRERGEKPPTPEDEARAAEWIAEMNRAAEEALANPDPEIEEELNRKHPVAEQAFELSIRIHSAADEHGWIPAGASDEHPVADLVSSVMCAAGKFAGALNGREWPPSVLTCADSIVRLKRARGYLDDALLAAECCAEQQLVEPAWLAKVQRELTTLMRDGDQLISELRELLARGFD